MLCKLGQKMKTIVAAKFILLRVYDQFQQAFSLFFGDSHILTCFDESGAGFENSLQLVV